MEEPVALLITWTCYGTWLPGDPRGYVSDTLTHCGSIPRENVPGTPYTADDPHTLNLARQRQKHETTMLSPQDAHCVAEALVGAARERRWCIHAAAVMSNHVHVVIGDCPLDGSLVRRALKGVAQAALSRMHGSVRRWWTHGGSDRLRKGELSLVRTTEYVKHQKRILAAVLRNEVVSPDDLTMASFSG